MKFKMKQPNDLSDYYHAFNSENIQYYDSIKKYFLLTKNIKGDIIEFGIGRGRSTIAICHLIHENKLKKNFFAFDSFKGFGYITKEDISPRKAKNKDWSYSPKNQFKYNKANIKKVLSKHIYKKNFKNVKLIGDYVEKSLPKNIDIIESISFINLDLDLYSGHKIVLEQTFKKLSKHGIIYFDDVGPQHSKKKFPGAEKAVIEFFKDKKNIKKFVCEKRNNLIIQKT